MKMDLPLSVVVDICMNSAQRLVECSKSYRPIAARIIRQFIKGAPQYDRVLIRMVLRDSVRHLRKHGRPA